MELLLSDIPPAKFLGVRTTRAVWDENLRIADSLSIATGYISSDSLIELNKIVEVNKGPSLRLMIGMSYFEGFTRQQYTAAVQLNQTLRSSDLGSVLLADKAKFHGKLYSFCKKGQPYAAIIGSSNLGSMFHSSDRLYEADCLFTEISSVTLVHKRICEIHKSLGTYIHDLPVPSKFREVNSLLEDHYGVEPVTKASLAETLANLTDTVFEIPIKTEQKSNLNAFFGKGRVNQRGFEMPRPWYEVEIIVSKNITGKRGYPTNRKFTVITDDGWSFKCSTNGDYSKNLRSFDDLKILGKWIKGRLEGAGSLEIGKPVTDQVLSDYGRRSLTLRATKNKDVWYLSFGV